MLSPAAFGRLCVETTLPEKIHVYDNQPPSGGCVLKLILMLRYLMTYFPAAFGRLCVETNLLQCRQCLRLPAAFGRLCVETLLDK